MWWSAADLYWWFRCALFDTGPHWFQHDWSVCRLVEKIISAGISTVLQSTAFASSVVGLLSGAKEATASLLSFAAIWGGKVGKIEGWQFALCDMRTSVLCIRLFCRLCAQHISMFLCVRWLNKVGTPAYMSPELMRWGPAVYQQRKRVEQIRWFFFDSPLHPCI